MGGWGMEFGEKVQPTKLLRIVRSIYPALRRIRRRCDDDVLSILFRKITLFGQLCDGRGGPWRRRRILVLKNILLSGKTE